MSEAEMLEDDKGFSGMTAEPMSHDTYHWKGTIFGPRDTPYDVGMFIIDIIIPANYPFKAPKMKFDTKVWHPNVSSLTGEICGGIFKEHSPALLIKKYLISVQLHLSPKIRMMTQ